LLCCISLPVLEQNPTPAVNQILGNAANDDLDPVQPGKMEQWTIGESANQ
jgi:hypothetical protein